MSIYLYTDASCLFPIPTRHFFIFNSCFQVLLRNIKCFETTNFESPQIFIAQHEYSTLPSAIDPPCCELLQLWGGRIDEIFQTSLWGHAPGNIPKNWQKLHSNSTSPRWCLSTTLELEDHICLHLVFCHKNSSSF